MSTEFRRRDENIFDVSAWISQSEAARLRGVTRASISALAKRHRIETLKIGGKVLVNRESVENFRPQKTGRKPKKKRNEAESTPPQDRRQSTGERSESKNRPSQQPNESLTGSKEDSELLKKYISQLEAARIRGVTKQDITYLIKRGHLTKVVVAGHTVVLRSEVEAFVPQPRTGRPPKKKTASKNAAKRAKTKK